MVLWRKYDSLPDTLELRDVRLRKKNYETFIYDKKKDQKKKKKK